MGSVNEVIGCLDCALDDRYIDVLEHQKYLKLAENLIRQLKTFLSKVRKDNKRY